jgi:hypothetical protein
VTDNGDGTFTLANVRRSLLDTVPTAHTIGDDVWFIVGDNVVDDVFDWEAAIRVKVTPKTFSDALAVSAAPYDALTLQKRALRPLRPAYVRFDGGTAFAPPALGTGAHTVTWANRSRLSATVRSIVDTANEFEPGQQTVLRYRKNAGAWTSVFAAPGEQSITVDYEIYSTRDGLDSFSKWSFTAGASSGSGSNPDTGGGSPPDNDDPYEAPPLPFSVAGGFTTALTASEIFLLYTFAEPVTFPDDFAGSQATCGGNPAATQTIDVKKNNVSVGSIAISTGGAFTFTSSGAVSFAADDELRLVGPATAGTALNVSITLIGSKDD